MATNNHVGIIPQGYISPAVAETGRILLMSMTILFMLLFFLFIIHLYFRWIMNRSRAQTPNFVYSGQTQGPLPSSGTALCNSGLDPSVVESLPTFVYAVHPEKEGLECAICLSAFEEKDKGRLLPECKHGFHVDCIDMWFQSHSTCPICRGIVKEWHCNSTATATADDGADRVVLDVLPIDDNDDSGMESSDGGAAILAVAEPDSFREANVVIPVPEYLSRLAMKQTAGLECPERKLGKSQPESPLMRLKKILTREGGRSSSSMACDGNDIEAGREDR